MSGFDENPFGEPMVNNDPFSDPSVRKAVGAVTDRDIDDYNPFADQPSGIGQQVRGAANPPIYGGATTITAAQPAMLQTSSQEAPPPNYNRPLQSIVQPVGGSSGMFSPTGSTQPLRNEGWKRNDQDMNNTPYYPRRNNWPPFPENCCVQPCFYQDIDVEIQTDFQRIVRQLYHLWIFHVFCLLINVVGGLLLLLTTADFAAFGVGLVYLMMFTPFSFICWFRPAYQAFKSDSSFNFMVFFLMFFFQTIITVFQAIGFPGAGTCGLIKALSHTKATLTDVIIGLLIWAIAISFCLAAAADIILLSKVHRIYRSTGASVVKAQEEFTSTFLRNEHVQNAASNVAASAVRAQVNNMTQPRY